MRQKKYGRLAITPETHQRIRIMAAEQSISMKALTERLIRLGMVAPRIAYRCGDLVHVAEQHADPSYCGIAISRARTALAAYQAALEGKETA